MNLAGILKERNFLKLWGSQILSLIAQNLLNFALIIRIYDLTRGTSFANIAVSLVILSFGIPSILFAAAAGVYVDNWKRKKVLITANFIRTVLALGFLVFEHNLALVLLTTFLIATTTQFFAPAEAASIPVLVEPENLLQANALFIFTFYATFIVGYGLAAPIINYFGDQAPYMVTTVGFGLATLLAIWLPTIGAAGHRSKPFKQILSGTYRELMKTQRLIRNNVHLDFPIRQLMLVQAMVSVLVTLAPALSLALLKRPIEHASPYVMVPAAVGIIIGLIGVNRLTKRVHKTVIIGSGLVLAGAAMATLGLSGLLYRTFAGEPLATTPMVGYIVAVIIMLFALANAVVGVSAQTLLHENTDDASRGAVFGALYTLVNIAATLPVLFAGILADLTSVTKVIALGGIIILLIAIYEIYWLLRHRRYMARVETT